MRRTFRFVEIPTALTEVVGVPDEGTRIYRQEGPEEDAGAWFDILHEMFGSLVSPGGVGMYAPVSRAAVYKSLKDGNLTAFSYYPTHSRTGLVRQKRRLVRDSPLVYIPVSECKGWGEELTERLSKSGKIDREELEREKPDWIGDFWEWRSKWRRKRNPRDDD